MIFAHHWLCLHQFLPMQQFLSCLLHACFYLPLIQQLFHHLHHLMKHIINRLFLLSCFKNTRSPFTIWHEIGKTSFALYLHCSALKCILTSPHRTCTSLHRIDTSLKHNLTSPNHHYTTLQLHFTDPRLHFTPCISLAPKLLQNCLSVTVTICTHNVLRRSTKLPAQLWNMEHNIVKQC